MWKSLICILSLTALSPLTTGDVVVKEEKFELPKIEGFTVQHIMYSKDYKTLALFDPEKKIIYFQDMETGSLYSWDYGALGYKKVDICDWEPSGKKFIFLYKIKERGNWEKLAIYSIPEGEIRTLVSLERAMGSPPQWSPDGKWIALYAELKKGDGYKFWLISSDGKVKKKIGNFGSWGRLVWSNTGRYLAYNRFKIGPPHTPYLWIYDLKRDTHRLIEMGGDLDKAFSPDDKWIVFNSKEGNLWIAKVDGTEMRTLVKMDGSSPRWSPDGKMIAFYHVVIDPVSEKTLESDVYVVNADGTGLKRVTFTKSGEKFRWEDDSTLVIWHEPELKPRR